MNEHIHKQHGCRCPKLCELLSENARLKEENERLKRENNRLKKKGVEKPFGLSTPSSKQLIKPSTEDGPSEEMKRRMGGAQKGHVGHGRKKPNDAEIVVEDIPPLDICPSCGEKLVDFLGEEEETRDIVDCEMPHVFRRRIRRHVHYCPNCKKPVRRRIAGVLPKYTLSNNVLASVVTDHYLHGITMGVIARRHGVNKSALFEAMHRLSDISKGIMPVLIGMLRDMSSKHADETGWRCDGKNGYTWSFSGGKIRIFKCMMTRSSSVAKDVLGFTDEGDVVVAIENEDGKALRVCRLMTDRYGGYGFYPQHDYCYEHLKRDVLKIVEDNPKSKDCKAFSEELVPLLCEAMKFPKTFDGDNINYLLRAGELRARIENVIYRDDSKHPSVMNIREIFRKGDDHLWGWAMYPNMPAENNAAERAVRPLVVARKVSHGSQSEKGLETRSVLMSLVHTLNACGADVAEVIKEALDKYAEDPGINIFDAYFEKVPLCVSRP